MSDLFFGTAYTKPLNQKQFAERHNVSATAVLKQMNAGKIPFTLAGDGKTRLVDPEKGDAAVEEHGLFGKEKYNPGPSPGMRTLLDEQKEEKHWTGKVRRLEYLEKANRVVALEGLIREWGNMLGVMKTRLRAVPSSQVQEISIYVERAAHDIAAGKETQREIYAEILDILSRPIDEALQELSSYEPNAIKRA